MVKFRRKDIRKAIKQEPWIKEIASKPVIELTNDDCQRVLLQFCCKHWRLPPWLVSPEDVGDVLLEIQTMI